MVRAILPTKTIAQATPNTGDRMGSDVRLRGVKAALVWVAYGVFSLCMVASVASYFWSADYFWWPLLFSAAGMAVIPVLFGPAIRAFMGAFRD